MTKGKTNRFWLIAGNGTSARVFAGAGPAAKLEVIAELENPEGRTSEQGLVTDRPGRRPDSSGNARSAVGEASGHDHSLDEFAREIADRLQRGRDAGEFDRASIVLSPSMLGRVRAVLKPSVRELVLEEISADLTNADADEIQAMLTRLA